MDAVTLPPGRAVPTESDRTRLPEPCFPRLLP